MFLKKLLKKLQNPPKNSKILKVKMLKNKSIETNNHAVTFYQTAIKAFRLLRRQMSKFDKKL